jgi:hypothetical protein
VLNEFVEIVKPFFRFCVVIKKYISRSFFDSPKKATYICPNKNRNEIRSQHMYEALFARLPEATRVYVPGKNVMI